MMGAWADINAVISSKSMEHSTSDIMPPYNGERKQLSHRLCTKDQTPATAHQGNRRAVPCARSSCAINQHHEDAHSLEQDMTVVSVLGNRLPALL